MASELMFSVVQSQQRVQKRTSEDRDAGIALRREVQRYPRRCTAVVSNEVEMLALLHLNSVKPLVKLSIHIQSADADNLLDMARERGLEATVTNRGGHRHRGHRRVRSTPCFQRLVEKFEAQRSSNEKLEEAKRSHNALLQRIVDSDTVVVSTMEELHLLIKTRKVHLLIKTRKVHLLIKTRKERRCHNTKGHIRLAPGVAAKDRVLILKHARDNNLFRSRA